MFASARLGPKNTTHGFEPLRSGSEGEALRSVEPRSRDTMDAPTVGKKRSGWFDWAPLNKLADRAQRLVHTITRTAPAVAAVSLGLMVGACGYGQGVPVDAVAAAQQTEVVAQQPSTYVVKPGDNLTRIAERLGTTPHAIAVLNDLSTPSLIHPGQTLKIPVEVAPDRVSAANEKPPTNPVRTDGATPNVDAPATYVVRRNDRLDGISRRVGISVERLVELNGIRNPNLIQPGQVLKLRADVTPERARTTPPPQTVTVLPRGTDGISHLSAADRAIFTDATPRLTWGMTGHAVEVVQTRLLALGYPLGTPDGSYGSMTRSAVRAFQAFNGIDPDGVIGSDTKRALASANAVRLPSGGMYEVRRVYRPYTADAYRLFLRAAQEAGVPRNWAIADSLQQLVDAESDGEVGRPNYTYGRRANNPSSWSSIHDELRRGRITATSSATGIGQLLLSNVEAHYPSGRAGINVPLEEAVGMLSYIEDRHGTPDRAWRNYNSVHEGY